MTIKLGILASGSGSNAQAMIDAVESGKLDAEICVIIANRSPKMAPVMAATAALLPEWFTAVISAASKSPWQVRRL